MNSRWRLSGLAAWAILAVLLAGAPAAADETYYSVPLAELKFSAVEPPGQNDGGGPVPAPLLNSYRYQPYVVLEGAGEVYLVTGDHTSANLKSTTQECLVIRVAAPRKIAGTLFSPKPDMSGFVKRPFVIEAEPSRKAKLKFAEAKERHYQDLLSRGVAGAAWFRHQVRDLEAVRPAADAGNQSGTAALEQTFELFGGTRAISENLQLERALPPVGDSEALVPLDSLEGISVAEIDWKPLIKGMQPGSDPLAKLVPADQHIVLFPSFAAFAQVADRLVEQGAIVMRLAQPQSVDSPLLTRYEGQLGLSLSGLGRIVGPQIVGSMALTGSDPYFLSGTDVALVLETTQPEVLKKLLLAQVAAKGAAGAAAKRAEGKVGSLAYSGMRSADRQISSYVAALDGAVVVTNSPYQLERFAAVASGQTPSVASLDEFTFFRHRYPRGDKEESALVFLSDATIRRWCGPRWRIGASRVVRDAAVLAELQAAYLDKLVKNQSVTGPLKNVLPFASGGELTLSADGVQSSVLGNLDFITPIAELQFDQVTQTEAEAYKNWRDHYQDKWRWAFDPIALRLDVGPNHLASDLTVMPLIAGSQYREIVSISRGAAIAPDAGDRHDAIVQLVLALNTKSDFFRLQETTTIAPWDVLTWLGQSVSLYVDDDPFWADLRALKTAEERRQFFSRHLRRLPVALWLEVADGRKLIEFLGRMKEVRRQVVPGTTWESLDYRGQAYAKIVPPAEALGTAGVDGPGKLEFFYVAADKFFLLTLSESLLKRAIDRQLVLNADQQQAPKAKAAEKATDGKQKAAPDTDRGSHPWLGSNLALQIDDKLLPLLLTVGGDFYQQAMRIRSWSNLPILNEWHRLYPDQDPLALHQRIWHERLVCPGGGRYVWNEAWQTMESTAYGHPGEPKSGPAFPAELLNLQFANFGLSFEGEGLRARMTLDRQTPAAEPAKPQP